MFDLTNCSISDVIALQQKHGSICGSIQIAQVAAAALSLSAVACQSATETRTTGVPLPPPPKATSKTTAPDPMILGEICVPAPTKPTKKSE
ncbi:MAG: hypothetical protein HC845_05950 [Akkermansiaceae bacterium]|nr:hypothetical protein [Akkermansiaceae bacterium]